MVEVRDNSAAVLARTYEFKYNQGQFFEPCRDFLLDHDEDLSDGCGWDFCVDVYGWRQISGRAGCGKGRFLEHMSSKNNKFSEYYAAIDATAKPTRSNK
jgi:hypothetical protein